MPEENGHAIFISLREFEQRHMALEEVVTELRKTLLEEMARDRADRKESLDKAASTIQTGLDKAERTLQTALVEAEKRVNEKFEPVRSTQANFDNRLTSIEKERPLYVTRDQLDLVIKSVAGEVRPLERARAVDEGKSALSMPLLLALTAAAAGIVVFIIEKILGK